MDRRVKKFHNLDDTSDGLFRELAPGVTTRIFSGEQAMLSVVTLAPNAQGVVHHHPEEQWGVLLEGSAVRVQGGKEMPVKKGDEHVADQALPVGLLRGIRRNECGVRAEPFGNRLALSIAGGQAGAGGWWARLGSNQRPLRCQRSALPLSYAPGDQGQGSLYRLRSGRQEPSPVARMERSLIRGRRSRIPLRSMRAT